MLFNSYAFLFVYLPLALLGYEIAGRFGRRAVIGWLGLASLAFYGYWRPVYVLLLIGSIGINFLASALISRKIPNQLSVKTWLVLAITVDLLILGYCKYLFPFLNYTSHLAGLSRHWADLALPLGISFFTFTQIAYLVDLTQGVAQMESLPNYVLFVTFFPHLIAGPILHHKQMMPQFRRDGPYRLRSADVAMGFSWFVMGLSKKVLLADTFAKSATLAYSSGAPLGTLMSWRGVLAYALQLYFDFSGYSDMALGLARMFSIHFPLNFASPYKATSVIDFWTRWHITLSQYINAYLYTPLQMSIRKRRTAKGKKVNRAAVATPGGFVGMVATPTLTTMFLAGIWHGAGWQYIMYGVLHGFYLSVNHAWRIFRPQPTAEQVAARGTFERLFKRGFSILLTFLAVQVTLVFFRASDCTHAVRMLAGMIGLHGTGTLALGGENHLLALQSAVQIACGLVIVWALPNTQQILSRFNPSYDMVLEDAPMPRWAKWTPTGAWALVVGVLFLASTVGMLDPSTFLYFQF